MATTDKVWQLDHVATRAKVGGFRRDLDVGTQLADCGQDLGAQLLADLAERIPDGIPSRVVAPSASFECGGDPVVDVGFLAQRFGAGQSPARLRCERCAAGLRGSMPWP